MKTIFFEQIDSTNTQAKRMINEGLSEPVLLVARHQTSGRGRQGKTFYSPSDTGIYMTVVLQPECPMDEAVTLTTTVACIVAQSIEKVYGICPGIKWVNDLYLNDKKICGILCEAVNDYENKLLKHVIIGIGINMSTDDYPDDIKAIAGSLLGDLGSTAKVPGYDEITKKSDDMNRFDVTPLIDKRYNFTSLVSRIADELKKHIPAKFTDFINFYKAHSVIINKEIYFIENGNNINARAVDIDSDGGLVVILEDGSEKILRSGEISVRVR